MTDVIADPPGRRRFARGGDGSGLLALWDVLFDEVDSMAPWKQQANEWFDRHLDDHDSTHISVIELAGELVAAAVGTLELGVPNPYCPRGRTVRLANVVTLPAHRGHGYATELVRDVIVWATSIGADRVDLSATSDGRRIYEQLGFTLTSAPRMKLVL